VFTTNSIHLKMQQFESKFKKRSLALLKRENALKMKESELERKEKEVLLFASNTSTHSIPSSQSRSNQSSPNGLEMGSQDSDKSIPSEISSKTTSARNVVSPSSTTFTLGRATSITSTLNTSKTSSDKYSYEVEMADTVDCTHDVISERKEESPQKEDSNVLWSDTTMHSTGTMECKLDREDSSQILLNGARNFLMKRVNLSDLSESDKSNGNDLSGSEDKTNETLEEGDEGVDVGGVGGAFDQYLVDNVNNIQISGRQHEWIDRHDGDGDGAGNRRHVVLSNNSNHSFSFRTKDTGTHREDFRTSHRDIKSARTKSFY